jgi:ADP-ribosyl-[dinitrogen reductase] hydrolase
VDACRYYGGLLLGALYGRSKQELLSAPPSWKFLPDKAIQSLASLAERVLEVANGSFKHHHPPRIKGSGYVVRGMEAALWAFFHTNSFRDGALLAVNLGDDADTTGAIYGQLAGAYYGEEGIPAAWQKKLAKVELIRQYADKLWESSQK